MLNTNDLVAITSTFLVIIVVILFYIAYRIVFRWDE